MYLIFSFRYCIKLQTKTLQLLASVVFQNFNPPEQCCSLEQLFRASAFEIYRGYYTVARRYEFYFLVAKQYFTNERS